MGTQTYFRQVARTPLAEHSVLRSDSCDETRAFLRNKYLDLRPTQARALSNGFSAAIDSAYLPRMYLAYMEYGTAVEMTALAPDQADYGVHLPLGGWVELRNGDQTIQCEAGHAAVVSPSNHLSLTASEGCQRLLLCVKREALTDHLATMLGDVPRERLVFVPDADPSQPGGQRLANAVRYAAQKFAHKDSIHDDSVLVAQFEQFFMTLLLMSQPNNYSDALNRRDSGARPRDVKRAIDYIQANLGLAITLEDLVAASGVPGRTLYQHFYDFVGTSPMAYVKKARYERVRDDLVRLNGERTVTEIASHWGFTHMGRFSAEYRRRFRELPSVTAGRRGRSRS